MRCPGGPPQLGARDGAEIAADVAGQVEAEGWVSETVTEDAATAVRTWARTFDDGIEMLAFGEPVDKNSAGATMRSRPLRKCLIRRR